MAVSSLKNYFTSSVEAVKEKGAAFPLALIRIVMGFMLVWAFMDKMFGLGFQTPAGKGVIDGGSPTHDFLIYNDGLFSSFFNWLGNFSGITDILMMMGLLLIGTALLLGIAAKLTTIFGIIFMIFMFLAVFPASDNPLVDYHVIYILAFVAMWLTNAGDHLGLGKRWRDLSIVKRWPMLE